MILYGLFSIYHRRKFSNSGVGLLFGLGPARVLTVGAVNDKKNAFLNFFW